MLLYRPRSRRAPELADAFRTHLVRGREIIATWADINALAISRSGSGHFGQKREMERESDLLPLRRKFDVEQSYSQSQLWGLPEERSTSDCPSQEESTVIRSPILYWSMEYAVVCFNSVARNGVPQFHTGVYCSLFQLGS